MQSYRNLSLTGKSWLSCASILQRIDMTKSSLTSKAFIKPNARFMSSQAASVRKTCLYDFHVERQARMQLFAGYMMPIVYKNQTITSEHIQTRDKAGAFDVSHMMQTIVRGKDRVEFIESLTVADVQGMPINKCALSVLTNESGGIIDDCIIGKREHHLHIVSNAGNAELVWNWLNKNKSAKLDVKLERLDGRGLIALQGPEAANVLQKLVQIDLSELEFMSTTDTQVAGLGECIVTRCGYTGEDGFEISIDQSEARELMDVICKHQLVLPAGLGARDTLRLEAGLCLHGHDITDQTTPVEAALNWVVQKRRRTNANFPGSSIIVEQLKSGSKTKRIGLVAEGSGPPAREGSIVKTIDGVNLGKVTSGTFAPKLNKNIAMAYVPTDISKKIGSTVFCDVRGKAFEYKISKMPFIPSNYYTKVKN